MVTHQHKQRGYTLLELLIAVTIGVVIMFAVTTTMTGSIQTSATSIRNSQFEQEMRAAMSVIVRDLRRAGWSSKATDDLGTGTMTNEFLLEKGEPVSLWNSLNTPVPYTTLAPAVTLVAGVATPTPNPSNPHCVTFSYDAETGAGKPDGVLTLGASSVDMRGFKIDTSSGIGVLKVRRGATAKKANCTQGTWETLTSSELNVTNLEFGWMDYTDNVDPTVTPGGSTPTPAPSATSCPVSAADNTKILQRTIKVTLTAKSVKDPNLERTLVDYVKVRNHLYNPCGN